MLGLSPPTRTTERERAEQTFGTKEEHGYEEE